jgi:hypothetical protein
MFIQIVPRLPPHICGIGDYAVTAAKNILEHYQIPTVFIKTDSNFPGEETTEGFKVIELNTHSSQALLSALAEANPKQDNPEWILLQYEFYQFHSKGCPVWLIDGLKKWKQGGKHRKIAIMFHELYTYTIPRRREILLRPYQMHLVKTLIRLSDACFTSNPLIMPDIKRMASHSKTLFAPVYSNFGEPALSHHQLQDREARRWVIAGSTPRLQRSFTTFLNKLNKLPSELFPDHLDLIGGYENSEVRSLMQKNQDFKIDYYPEVTHDFASSLLAKASFSFIDYFSEKTQRFYPGLVFKSGTFAANSAHGVVTIFNHEEPASTLEYTQFPDFFTVVEERVHLPDPRHLSVLRAKIHEWYQHHSNSMTVAQSVVSSIS